MPQKPQVWKVQAEIKKYLTLTERYVLSVSGGADSLALLAAVVAVFAGQKDKLLVCHVEHGIRGAEALQDAELVRTICDQLHVDYVCCHVDVPQVAKTEGISLEAAARKLRYAALAEQAHKFSAKAIVTAHQADDQAETVLWKLLRGAGSDGLSGMARTAQQDGYTIVRPLLDLTRADLEAYCHACGLSYCNDSTNGDVQYTRNRIRHELLPYLAQNFNPNIKTTLARTAQLFSEEQACLDALALDYLQNPDWCVTETQAGQNCIVIKITKLLSLPGALRKRLLRQAFFRLGGKELSYERTQALDRLCLAQVGGKIIQLGDGVQAVLKNKKIYLSSHSKAAAE